MAAGDKIYICTSFDVLAAVTHVGIEASTVVVEDPGAIDAPGPADFLVTHKDLAVTVYGNDEAELLALVGAAAAQHTVGTIGDAGAAEALTLHDAYFDEVPGEVVMPAADAGGRVPEFAVRGHCNWVAGETFANKLTAA